MRLAAIRPEPSAPPVVGVEIGGRVLTLHDLDPSLVDSAPTVVEVLFSWRRGLADRVAEAVAAAIVAGRFDEVARPLHDLLLAPPVAARQVVAVGRNYREHAAEQAVDAPAVPMLFAKLPHSLIGSGDTIEWDPTVAAQVDYEAELGVVIGEVVRGVAPERALDTVFGYCNVNDVTARDLQRSEGQWLRGKSHDTFCPLGPVVVTADEVPDPHALTVTCSVDGEERQRAGTGDMIFPIAELISHISRAITLLPGDVIATGTPAGVGMHRNPPALLADGSEVVVEVTGPDGFTLGRLTNRCRTRPRGGGSTV